MITATSWQRLQDNIGHKGMSVALSVLIWIALITLLVGYFGYRIYIINAFMTANVAMTSLSSSIPGAQAIALDGTPATETINVMVIDRTLGIMLVICTTLMVIRLIAQIIKTCRDIKNTRHTPCMACNSMLVITISGENYLRKFKIMKLSFAANCMYNVKLPTVGVLGIEPKFVVYHKLRLKWGRLLTFRYLGMERIITPPNHIYVDSTVACQIKDLLVRNRCLLKVEPEIMKLCDCTMTDTRNQTMTSPG